MQQFLNIIQSQIKETTSKANELKIADFETKHHKNLSQARTAELNNHSWLIRMKKNHVMKCYSGSKVVYTMGRCVVFSVERAGRWQARSSFNFLPLGLEQVLCPSLRSDGHVTKTALTEKRADKNERRFDQKWKEVWSSWSSQKWSHSSRYREIGFVRAVGTLEKKTRTAYLAPVIRYQENQTFIIFRRNLYWERKIITSICTFFSTRLPIVRQSKHAPRY